MRMWTGFIHMKKRPVAGSCECDNEPSDIVKGGQFLDKLSDYQIIVEDPAPWSQLYKKLKTNI